MTAWLDDDIFDDVFHVCALHAWLELAAASGGFPDEEATRRSASRSTDFAAPRSAESRARLPP